MVRRAVLLAMGALFGLGACAAPRPAEPPPPGLDFAGTKGSAVGNWPSVPTGEVWRSEAGADCPVFIWDRPRGDGTVARFRSASCQVPGRPGVFVPRDLGRQVVPLAQSAVAQLPPPEPPPRDPVSATVPVVRVTVAPLPP